MLKIRKYFGGLGNSMFQYAYIYAQWKRGILPDIYIQDTKYFAGVEHEIINLYRQGIGQPTPMVSMHVRRGDYVNNPFYVDLTQTDYYERAMAQFPPGTRFLIFCADRQTGSNDKSDMEWCKKRWHGSQFDYFQGSDELEDFNKMASCEGHIIANSTFSWWAAYLNPDHTVVAPKKWFTDGIERVSIPDNWKRI